MSPSPRLHYTIYRIVYICNINNVLGEGALTELAFGLRGLPKKLPQRDFFLLLTLSVHVCYCFGGFRAPRLEFSNTRRRHLKTAIVLFACPASADGEWLGPEMAIRVKEVLVKMWANPSYDLLVASTASGYKPNEKYSVLVRMVASLVGLPDSRIKICYPSASTVSEVDGMQKFLSEHPEYDEVIVAAGYYQVPRTRFIWWWRHKRQTKPAYLPMHGVPNFYLLQRCLMEPLKFVLYFVLPTRMQDDVNHKLLGPRGL